ncbi:MAG: hypothetical protein GY771_07920 [bacterium]|nr:hypothetical protein [bacterium]
MNRIILSVLITAVLLLISCGGGDPYLSAAAMFKGVKVTMRPDIERYEADGPFPFTVRVHNISDEEITVRHMRDDAGNYANLRFFYVKDGKAQYGLEPPYITTPGIDEYYDVEPGQYIETRVDLIYWGFEPETGSYEVFAEYDVDVEVRSDKGEWIGRALSNRIDLEFE